MYHTSNPSLDLHIKERKDKKRSRSWMSLRLVCPSCLFKVEKAQLHVCVTQFVVKHAVLVHSLTSESGFPWLEDTRVSIGKLFSFHLPIKQAKHSNTVTVMFIYHTPQLSSVKITSKIKRGHWSHLFYLQSQF